MVCKADADIGDLIANQHHLSGLLGVEPDEACKDASRASFAPQQEEILFINDAIFDYQDDVFEEKFGEQYRNGRCKMDDVQHQPSAFSPQTSSFSPQPSYKGIPYADIINEYWQRTGGVPVDGERNVRLHKLAVNLRAICENKPDKLLEVIPRLGLSEQEVRSVVESACKESPKGFSTILRNVVKDLQEQRNIDDGEPDLPPEMPKKLPRLIQLLLS